jgi:hypothetical protein
MVNFQYLWLKSFIFVVFCKIETLFMFFLNMGRHQVILVVESHKSTEYLVYGNIYGRIFLY